MLTIIGITLIGVGTMTTYVLCKAAGVQSTLEEQDEVLEKNEGGNDR